MNCPLCSETGHLLENDIYAHCSSCYAYYKDPGQFISPEEEKSRYELHENNVEDPGYQKFTSPITRKILEYYTPEHQGLDFGSGTGPVITHVLAQKGYRIVLYDPFFHPDKSYLSRIYDFIFSCEVFEHFKNPHHEISELLKILKPGGRLIIMTHLFDSASPFATWYYRKDPTHIFIYTPKTIKFIAHAFQLEIEEITDRLIVLRKQ